jgi:DNA-binding transcriptional LysR family regulator
VDAASDELAAHVGLQAGRVRLAAFQTVLSTLAPEAASELARRHPGVELNVVDVYPPEALPMLRAGQVDVALVFGHADTPREDEGFASPTCSTTRCLIAAPCEPDPSPPAERTPRHETVKRRAHRSAAELSPLRFILGVSA